MAALFAGKAMLRGVEAAVNTLGEVAAHPVLFLSALAGLAGLLFGLEFIPSGYPVEAKIAIVSAFVAICGSVPFVLWALHYWTRRAMDWISRLLRPHAEKAADRVKASAEHARAAHLATVARVSRIPLLIKALAGGSVAVAAGTVAILALPPLIVPQASTAPRLQAKAPTPRQPERRITTSVLTHPREPAPIPLAVEAPPLILQPVAASQPYHPRYLHFFQHHRRQPSHRGKLKGIRR